MLKGAIIHIFLLPNPLVYHIISNALEMKLEGMFFMGTLVKVEGLFFMGTLVKVEGLD